MNNAINHFYKYQPIGPTHDLLCFEEIPKVENPCRLIQIARYDIELTAWVNEKELKLNIKERLSKLQRPQNLIERSGKGAT